MVKKAEQRRKINDNGHNAIHTCQNMANGLSSASCLLAHDVSEKTSMRVLSSMLRAFRTACVNWRALAWYVTQKSIFWS